MADDDIKPILDAWRFRPGRVTARRIEGGDGRPKIQLRLDLGLLQMETEGRPDGLTPYGRESLLEYYEDRLERYIARHGSDDDFSLSSPAVSALSAESLQYYYRYLAMFSLSDYEAVARDTARNLRVFDLVNKYAADEDDAWSLEEYRPYVVMMNTRARAHMLLDARRFREALDETRAGIQTIEDYYAATGRPEYAEDCREIEFLKSWAAEIEESFPVDPAAQLKRRLDVAVSEERFEDAARIRDALEKISRRRKKKKE